MRKLRVRGLLSLSTAAALVTILCATVWAHHSRGNFDLLGGEIVYSDPAIGLDEG